MKFSNKISSDFLFHFTSKFEYLAGILLHGFKPFYCLERLEYLPLKDSKNHVFEMAFPLVCFCDLPLRDHKIHKTNYGDYGIGLYKEWGIRKNLSPVIYCHERSLTAVSLKLMIEFALDYKSGINMEIIPDKFNGLNNSLSILLMNYKSYEGHSYNKASKDFENNITRFYDEREWRYLPINMDRLKYNIDRNEYENLTILEKENIAVQKENSLTFDLADIKYIFIKNQDEKIKLIELLSEKFSDSQLSAISSKIKI